MKKKGLWVQSGISVLLCFSAQLFCTTHILAKFMVMSLSLSSPDQVRDAGRILRERHSRGKRQFCTLIMVLTLFASHADTWI